MTYALLAEDVFYSLTAGVELERFNADPADPTEDFELFQFEKGGVHYLAMHHPAEHRVGVQAFARV